MVLFVDSYLICQSCDADYNEETTVSPSDTPELVAKRVGTMLREKHAKERPDCDADLSDVAGSLFHGLGNSDDEDFWEDVFEE